HAQRGERLRRRAVVIVGVGGAVQGADAGIAKAAEQRSLHREALGDAQLARRAERQRGARDAEKLRRDVVVAAVQAPDAAIALACLVIRAEQQATGREVLDRVRAGRAQLEAEVIPRPLVAIARLARQAIVHRVIDQQLVALDVGRLALAHLRGATCADLDSCVIGRVPAVQDLLEALTERGAVEAGRRRNRRRGELAPAAAVALLEHQVRHAKERLAEEAAGDAARYLVVPRGYRAFSGDLPQRAAGEGVAERL